MTTFNELIADLTRENLLDEVKIVLRETQNDFNFDKFSSPPELPSDSKPDFLTISENYELKLPDFTILQPENAVSSEENQIKAVFPEQNQVITFQNTQNLVKYQARRRKAKRTKSGKYCRTCDLSAPAFSLHCRYCHSRVVGDLYYYSLIMLSAIIFTMLIWFLVTSKSYS